MNKSEVPFMRKPCGNCPFRKDSKGLKHLGRKRAEGIAIQSQEDGFVCHKTVDYSIEQGQMDSGRKQCAGSLILAKKTKSSQPFMEMYESMFDEEMTFDNMDLIVDTYEEFIKIQS